MLMKTFYRALICLLALLLAVLPVAALAETAESIETGIREIQIGRASCRERV